MSPNSEFRCITQNLNWLVILACRTCCIISNFYIKSQLSHVGMINFSCCIISNFYIKS